MSSLRLNLNVNDGSTIEQASGGAVDIAKKLLIDVWFEFNDVKVLARHDDNPAKIVEAYNEVIKTYEDVEGINTGLQKIAVADKVKIK